MWQSHVSVGFLVCVTVVAFIGMKVYCEFVTLYHSIEIMHYLRKLRLLRTVMLYFNR